MRNPTAAGLLTKAMEISQQVPGRYRKNETVRCTRAGYMELLAGVLHLDQGMHDCNRRLLITIRP